MKKFRDLLYEMDACYQAKCWVEDKTVEEAIAQCHRGDWMLWMAGRLGIDLKIRTLAKARCAQTVLHLMEDERSRNAVAVAEKFALGQATDEELGSTLYPSYSVYLSAKSYYEERAALSAHHAADVTMWDCASVAEKAADGENGLQMANICREILGELIIQKINQLLK